jgi:hypothetical protein
VSKATLFDPSLANSKGGNAIPSAFAALEIDNNLKSHVQHRSPGVIFRLEAL